MGKNNTGYKKIVWILIVGIAFISLYSLFMIQQKANSSPIIIGFIGPLTSDVSNKGQGAKAAVELAVDEINEAGEINGRLLKVIYRDGGCDSAMAREAADDLIQNHNVSAILGGLCSHETLAFTDIAERSGTVVLSYCSTAPEISYAGDYIFRINPSSVRNAHFDAKYIQKIMDKQRVAILYVDVPWGIGLVNNFSEAFIKDGGEIVAKESYHQMDRDLNSQIARIQASNPEVIYFLGYPEASIAGLKQMKEVGLDIPIFGGGTLDDPTVWRDLGSAGDGVLYSIFFSPLNDMFKDNMRDRFGIDTILNCTPQAYDGIKILSQVINEVGSDSEKIKDALYHTVYNSGISSNQIEFDENGDVLDATYLIKRIQDGKAVEMKYYRTDQYGEGI